MKINLATILMATTIGSVLEAEVDMPSVYCELIYSPNDGQADITHGERVQVTLTGVTIENNGFVLNANLEPLNDLDGRHVGYEMIATIKKDNSSIFSVFPIRNGTNHINASLRMGQQMGFINCDVDT